MLINTMNCLYRSVLNTINHDGVEHAGYMAFLFLLSLFPFLIFLVAISSFIGESLIGAKFSQVILSNLPQNVSKALEPRINEIILGPPQSLMNLAIVGAIWTASSSVEGLRTILNRVYQIKTPPGYVWRRLLSVFQFLILTMIIISIMSIFITSSLILDKITNSDLIGSNFNNVLINLKKLESVWFYLRYIVIGIVLFIVVGTLYFIIPNIKLSWGQITPGALLVVIGWSIGGAGLSYYINHVRQLNLIYGSLGGIIIALIFFYLINLIFIYGAEFNYLMAKPESE